MIRQLTALSHLARSVAGLMLVSLACVASWFGYELYYAPNPELEAKNKELIEKTKLLQERDAEIENLNQQTAWLNAQVDVLTEQTQRLEMALRLLKVDRRVARVDVVRQWRDEDSGELHTRFRFVELGDENSPLHAPLEAEIQGDLIYVDYWIVKFNDELVEAGDALRSTSIALFRRIFGENQQPSEGFVLDEVGRAPAVYAKSEEAAEFESEIWENFWEYAVNSRQAEQSGVRSAHGEAPSIRLQEGKRYRIDLRASGGLSIKVEDPPPDAANAL